MKKSKKFTPMRNRRVLAIDPGFDRAGVAILKNDQVLFSDCIVTNRKKSHESRLFEIGNAVREIIDVWKPEDLVLETLFFNQNVSTAIKVAEARGIILYESQKAELEVFEYSPQAIKIAVTGYGKANKKQVEDMVKKLVVLPSQKRVRLDDELDAIALGITHLATKRGI